MNKPDGRSVDERNIKKLEAKARRINGLITSAVQFGRANSWQDLGNTFGVPIDQVAHTDFTDFNLDLYKQWNVARVREEYFKQRDQIDTKLILDKPRAESVYQPRQLGKYTLTPVQYKCANQVIEDFWIKKSHRAALFNWDMGLGKTFGSGGIIDYAVRENLVSEALSPFKVLVVCPKVMVIKWQRLLMQYGLTHPFIKVIGYGQITAGFGKSLVYTTTENYWGTDETILHIPPPLVPYIVVWDECHFLKNRTSRRAKFALAMNEHDNVYQIFLSATPWITINNAMNFVLACKLEWMGNRLNARNWMHFAKSICDDPDKPNIAAAKRLNKFVQKCVYVNRSRLPHKIVSTVEIVDFRSNRERERYDQAYEIYLQALERIGKAPPTRLARLVALNKFAHGVEVIKSEVYAEKILAAYNSGDFCPVVGLRFQDSLRNIVLYLCSHGVPRDQISLIWGGSKRFREDDILTDEQQQEMIERSMRGEILTKREIKQLEWSISFFEDRAKLDEDIDAQKYRMSLWERYGLYKQSDKERQENVDKFQDGHSRICIATIAAGGVGIDLDHQHDRTSQRKGWVTIPYRAEDIRQFGGRFSRIVTVSDTELSYPVYRGTVEQYSVAPVLEKKFATIKAVISSDEEFWTMFEHPIDSSQTWSPKAREQAELEAEQTKDVTNWDGEIEDEEEEEENEQIEMNLA